MFRFLSRLLLPKHAELTLMRGKDCRLEDRLDEQNLASIQIMRMIQSCAVFGSHEARAVD
jgi:hypothetical protein